MRPKQIRKLSCFKIGGLVPREINEAKDRRTEIVFITTSCKVKKRSRNDKFYKYKTLLLAAIYKCGSKCRYFNRNV